jgi:hypothetical protein
MNDDSQLVRDLCAPVASPIATLVARVMARLDDPPTRPRWPYLALAAAAVAAATLWFVVPRASDFAARGTREHELTRLVGITLFALDGELRPLAAGSRVTADTAYVAAYRNAGRAPAYALVFALDAAGDLHWLYPAFTDATADPPAIALAPTPVPALLADAVVLEQPAPGPLVLVAIVTSAPLRVSDIERMPHTLAALRARWPELEAVPVEVQPR